METMPVSTDVSEDTILLILKTAFSLLSSSLSSVIVMDTVWVSPLTAVLGNETVCVE